MRKPEASILAALVSLIIADSLLLLTHGPHSISSFMVTIAVPVRVPLEETLDLITSLTRFNQPLVITLLSSSLTPVTSLFLTVTENLGTLAPWFALFSFLLAVIAYAEKHWPNTRLTIVADECYVR